MLREILKRLWNTSIKNDPKIPSALQSLIIPTDLWKSGPNNRLIDLALQAVQYAGGVDHTDVSRKMIERPCWPDIWPGEHYKLLSGVISALKPKLVIEIGTATGYSVLSMKKFLESNSQIITFDIIPWKEYPKCILEEVDFQDGRIRQIIGDLSNKTTFDKHSHILKNADFIFIDAAKDGKQEQMFIDNFKTLDFVNDPIFMFDDIRLMNMIQIWNDLDKPKLDLTSFGHWSGTGLVDWKGSKTT